MSPARRNFMVGLVVLIGLGIFAWFLIKFSGQTSTLFSPAQLPVHFNSERADGLSEGSSVSFLGQIVGRVTKISRNSDQMSIRIDAMVDSDPPLPANVVTEIVQSSAIGGASTLQMRIPEGEQPSKESLAKDAMLEAKYVGLQLLPPSMTDTAAQIGKVSDQLAKVLQQWHDSGTLKDLDQTIRTVGAQGDRAGKVLDSVQTIVGDPQNQQNIKEALANFRTTTENLTKISTKLDKLSDNLQQNSTDASAAIKDLQRSFDDVSKRLADTLTITSAVMTDVHSITTKVDQGKGTAGQLVNDPKLYEALVENSRQLDLAVKTLNRLEEQWEQEGVSLKLK